MLARARKALQARNASDSSSKQADPPKKGKLNKKDITIERITIERVEDQNQLNKLKEDLAEPVAVPPKFRNGELNPEMEIPSRFTPCPENDSNRSRFEVPSVYWDDQSTFGDLDPGVIPICGSPLVTTPVGFSCGESGWGGEDGRADLEEGNPSDDQVDEEGPKRRYRWSTSICYERFIPPRLYG